MYRKLLPFALLVLGAVLFSVAAGVAAQGPRPRTPQVVQGSGFTYQGQLKQGGSALTAVCDMAFGLYDAASSGAQLGTAITTTVPVTAGLFSVLLNSGGEFGANAFNGDARWLDIQVRCPSGGGGFTALAPRQALSAAPYALYATGNWGLGGNANTSPGTNFIGTRDNQPLVLRTNNTEAMRIDASGNAGIGTTTPSDKLTVANGNIRAAQNTFLSEGFEGATFPPAGWTTGGTKSWARDTSTFVEGSASAAISMTGFNTASFLDIDYTMPASGQVGFSWKAALNGGNFLLFCLDNDGCTSGSGYNQRNPGNPEWAEVTAPVSAGAHSFRWVLTVGNVYSTNGEKGWLDRVRFTDAYGNVIADANVLANRVGIGTTNPSNQLSVVGNTDFMGRVGIGITRPVQLFHMNVITGQGEGIEVDSPVAGHAPAIYLNHTGNLGHNFRIASFGDNLSPGSFRVRDETAAADRLIIDGAGTLNALGGLVVNGNTGLGNATPTRRLDVNGVVGVFDSGAKTYNAGVATEGSSQMIDIGINDDGGNRFGGTYTSTQQGGFLRVDARPGQPLFGFFGRPAGSTNPVGIPLGYIGSGGTVRFEIGTSQKFSLGGNGTFEIDAPFVPAGRFYISDSGNVGIGHNTPSRILQLKQGGGNALGDGWDVYSSRRWKTNITTIDNALDKVQQLRGVTFDWKANGKHDVGLIAEEVGAVIPEVVKYEDNGVDAQSVDYARLVAVLIEATKEQQKQIAQQQQTIDTLQRDTGAQLAEVKQQNAALEARLSALEQNVQTKSAPAAANHAEFNVLADLTSGSNLVAFTLLGIVITYLVRGRKIRGS